MKKAATQIAVIAAVLAVVFLGGLTVGVRTRPACPDLQTRTDTVIIRDTIRIKQQVPVTVHIVRVDTIRVKQAYIDKYLADREARRDSMTQRLKRASDAAARAVREKHKDKIKKLQKPLLDIDSLFVDIPIPIERKTYQTEDYKAEIEGFRASLVSMEIYRQTQFITKTETLRIPDTRRWGIGLQAGYGLSVQSGFVKASPYIGVGVQYSILKW